MPARKHFFFGGVIFVDCKPYFEFLPCGFNFSLDPIPVEQETCTQSGPECVVQQQRDRQTEALVDLCRHLAEICKHKGSA